MKAIILSGGKGTRLRPLTDHTPKPMLPINGVPHLEYIVKLLRKHNITDIIFSTGYLHNQITEHFGNGEHFGVSIQYKEDGEKALGTAGAIKNCEDLLDGEDFLVFNGDILTNLNLADMIKEHKENKRSGITIALAPVEDVSQFGLAIMDNHKSIRGFVEKPTKDFLDKNPHLSKVINAGVYMLSNEVLTSIPEDEYFMIETEIFPEYTAYRKLFGYTEDMYWLDIGTHERYQQANTDILGILNYF